MSVSVVIKQHADVKTIQTTITFMALFALAVWFAVREWWHLRAAKRRLREFQAWEADWQKRWKHTEALPRDARIALRDALLAESERRLGIEEEPT